MAQTQRKNNGKCCRACNKTHEECADGKTCEKWEISLSVCEVFGTRPLPTRQKRQR